MAISVTFFSGPRRSGKSAVIGQLIESLDGRVPHYLRLSRLGGDKRRPPCTAPPAGDCGVATACWLEYDPAQIFATLSDKLCEIAARDHDGLVLIEGDADPSLRHAYPYHGRVFVMPSPSSVHNVFRTNAQAADALRAALDDSTVFATEMFGLCGDAAIRDDEGSESRPDLDPVRVEQFLRSALGTELGLRCQLQPAYHGLIESDIILINSAVGSPSPAVDEVNHRLESMLHRVQRQRSQTVHLYCCDPLDPRDPLRARFLHALYNLAEAGT